MDLIVRAPEPFLGRRVMDKCEMDEIADAVMACPDCAGRGFVAEEDSVCPRCRNTFMVLKPGRQLPCSSS